MLRINDWAVAARSVRKDVIVLCRGGPIATPEDAAYILDNCYDCHGFYGASSMERLPTETAIAEQTQQFERLTRRQVGQKSVPPEPRKKATAQKTGEGERS